MDDVAQATGIAKSSLTSFEEGTKQPSINQLMKLAKVYNIEFYRFFDKSVISPEAVLPDFRQSTPSASRLSIKGLQRIWAQESIAEFAHELATELGTDKPQTLNPKALSNRQKPDPQAVRAKFESWKNSKSSKIQFTGDHVEQSTKYLRLFLELHNCPTSMAPAPVDDYIGFYSECETHRTILINSNEKNAKRRLFTLAHEFCHFLIGEEGISHPFLLQNEIERRCNSFAGEFLAPEDTINDIINKASFRGEEKEISLIRQVSDHSLLSFQAAALRLNSLQIISNKSRSAAFSFHKKNKNDLDPVPPAPLKKIEGFSKGARAAMKISEVGILPAYTALLANEQKLIDHVDVKRGLGIPEDIQPHVFKLARQRYEGGAS
jgi:Zn-dependent peptidase ImmA (M78 family)/transcriptional regulator with XRE-family HTH domain